jgi:acetylornithine/succinyldiaminopimelate/putrescine aminotransferase
MSPPLTVTEEEMNTALRLFAEAVAEVAAAR